MQVLHKLSQLGSSLWIECEDVKYFWWDTFKAYCKIEMLMEMIVTRVSRSECDKKSIEELEELYFLVSVAWTGIGWNKVYSDAINHKRIRLNLIELKVFHRYRNAAFQKFYKCSEYVIDFRIKTGRVDPSMKAQFLTNIVHFKGNKYPLFQ